jgi:predicted RNase H-like HicB family nuclease
MSTVLTYPVQLTPAEEGGFIVTSPVISIYTHGATEEEALQNAEESIQCHLEGCEKDRAQTPSIRIAMIQVKAPDTMAA